MRARRQPAVAHCVRPPRRPAGTALRPGLPPDVPAHGSRHLPDTGAATCPGRQRTSPAPVRRPGSRCGCRPACRARHRPNRARGPPRGGRCRATRVHWTWARSGGRRSLRQCGAHRPAAPRAARCPPARPAWAGPSAARARPAARRRARPWAPPAAAAARPPRRQHPSTHRTAGSGWRPRPAQRTQPAPRTRHRRRRTQPAWPCASTQRQDAPSLRYPRSAVRPAAGGRSPGRR
ncbi:hypothetical protein D9M72_453080 [compost metagenome]